MGMERAGERGAGASAQVRGEGELKTKRKKSRQINKAGNVSVPSYPPL
jgi:hypothetical protein